MLSDSHDDDDLFSYTSSQNYSDIDYQVDLIEMRQSIKWDKYWKQKQKQNEWLCPISTRKLQSHAVLLKISCKRYEQKPKIEQKSFGYRRFSSSSSREFECDEKFLVETTNTETKKLSKSSKKLVKQKGTEFSNFRAQFYRKNHKNIKSSLNKCFDTKIVNIREAPINESVQSEFMKRLNQNSNPTAELVYHGTHFKNIKSILRFGLLIPNQAHPTDENAPIIQSVHGQAYGQGIYCSRRAAYSVSYAQSCSTLLACAAIPNDDQVGKVQYLSGSILVLPHVSQIIPLFFIDFSPTNGPVLNSPLYASDTQLQADRIPKEKQPLMIPEQILRKILRCMNNRIRKNERYQIRLPN
ncbi:unnamed protein product [Adineta steineri]|uniref:PARP catalytic domain-containing protein n=1 Tax=Adineta steineri TaxID=433720 RepID=A0A818TFQ7_9BILA|nr:unnamed protein product [Adineta steineri]CAF3679260.1 unnamed protein product [Adineta steineri]